jgi:phosphoribosylamine-glycine ligase
VKTWIDVIVFHGGTRVSNEQFLTAGGQVLSVAATGANLETAIKRAYEGVESIKFKNMFYRKDIGKRCVKPLEFAYKSCRLTYLK